MKLNNSYKLSMSIQKELCPGVGRVMVYHNLYWTMDGHECFTSVEEGSATRIFKQCIELVLNGLVLSSPRF